MGCGDEGIVAAAATVAASVNSGGSGGGSDGGFARQSILSANGGADGDDGGSAATKTTAWRTMFSAYVVDANGGGDRLADAASAFANAAAFADSGVLGLGLLLLFGVCVNGCRDGDGGAIVCKRLFDRVTDG